MNIWFIVHWLWDINLFFFLADRERGGESVWERMGERERVCGRGGGGGWLLRVLMSPYWLASLIVFVLYSGSQEIKQINCSEWAHSIIHSAAARRGDKREEEGGGGKGVERAGRKNRNMEINEYEMSDYLCNVKPCVEIRESKTRDAYHVAGETQ